MRVLIKKITVKKIDAEDVTKYYLFNGDDMGYGFTEDEAMQDLRDNIYKRENTVETVYEKEIEA